MDDAYLILDRRIRKDLEILDGLWDELAAFEANGLTADPRDVIVTGYRLHNLYNAVENILHNIAGTFGNHLDRDKGWHAELLDRMRLDLTPLRPAVITDPVFASLDELRRFRHVFRAAYTIELDPERLALVLRKALALRQDLPPQIDRFLDFLADLEP